MSGVRIKAPWHLALLACVVASLDEHQMSLKRLPEGLTQEELHQYWQGIGQLQAKELSQGNNVEVFPVDEVAEHVKPDGTSVPAELQGVWWWKGHPTMGAMIFTMYAGGSFSGAPYVSMVKPGGIAVPNTPKNVSDLTWFNYHGLEMSFPSLKAGNMTAGKSSTPVNTKMTGIYEYFPLPAAIMEGWNLAEAAGWDPKKSGDVAKCFCSIYYTHQNVLTRHNFGHYAYTGLRLVDGTGARTQYWAEFKAVMAAAGVKTFAAIKPPAELPEAGVLEKAISAPAHPGASNWLGKTVTENMVHSVNGKVAATSTGKMACEYGGFSAPIYLRASWHGTVKLETPRPSGATSLEVLWLGWNNVVQNIVDRYLIVKELDASGATIKEQCTTYPDKNPKGYSDPLPLMADRYKLVKSSAHSNEYVYQWELQNGAQMTSTMVSDPKGFPPRSVDVASTTRDGHNSAYNFSYPPPSDHVDSSIFYEYKKYDCAKVSNFTTPDICVDSWLVLQYECAFTEALNAEFQI